MDSIISFPLGATEVAVQCLGNTLMYYKQFSEAVEQAIQKLVAPVEKEFNVRETVIRHTFFTPSVKSLVKYPSIILWFFCKLHAFSEACDFAKVISFRIALDEGSHLRNPTGSSFERCNVLVSHAHAVLYMKMMLGVGYQNPNIESPPRKLILGGLKCFAHSPPHLEYILPLSPNREILDLVLRKGSYCTSFQ